MKIYIVINNSGSFDDRTSTPEVAFVTRELAEEYIKTLQKKHTFLWEMYNKNYDDYLKELDNFLSCYAYTSFDEDGPTIFTIREVELLNE